MISRQPSRAKMCELNHDSSHTRSANVDTYKTNVATFNVHGLASPYKKEKLLNDISRYNIDICCLKETKTTDDIDAETRNNRLILLPGQCRHYGLDWKDKQVGYKTMCDRIASNLPNKQKGQTGRSQRLRSNPSEVK